MGKYRLSALTISSASGSNVETTRMLHRTGFPSSRLLITVRGRRTGRRYTIPVGYQRHEDVLTILVSEAPKKQWWRNFHNPAPVEVRVKGKTLSGIAELITPASPEFKARAEETLRRLPWMGKVFGIEYRKGEALNEDQIRALSHNIAIVQVQLGH
jgi:deazaflavin-dependent oxidoreductase (nitroreductase family)